MVYYKYSRNQAIGEELVMVDMFNAPIKNRRNRNASKETLSSAAPSQNAQAVAGVKAIDSGKPLPPASPRILNSVNETAEQKIESSNKLSTQMKVLVDKFALKIAHDAQFNETLRNVYHAKRIAANGTLFATTHLERLYSSDDILAMPMGGETEEDVKGTNRQPDKYSKTYYDRVEAEKKTKVTSFYRELAEQMDEAQEWLRKSDNFRLAKKKQWDKLKLLAGEDANTFKRKNAAKYEQEIQVCTLALSDFTKWIRQGVSFLKQMALAATSKNVKVLVGKDEAGNYHMLAKPVTIRIEPPTDDDWVTMTVGSFLSIDIQAAIDNGDNWESWEKEMSREAEDDDTEDGGTIKGIPDLEMALANIASWVANAQDSATVLHNQLLSAINKKGTDDFVLSLFDVWSMLDGIVPHVKERVRILKTAESARQEAEKVHPANQAPTPTAEQVAAIEAAKQRIMSGAA